MCFAITSGSPLSMFGFQRANGRRADLLASLGSTAIHSHTVFGLSQMTVIGRRVKSSSVMLLERERKSSQSQRIHVIMIPRGTMIWHLAKIRLYFRLRLLGNVSSVISLLRPQMRFNHHRSTHANVMVATATIPGLRRSDLQMMH